MAAVGIGSALGAFSAGFVLLPWLGLAVGATIATTLYLLHPYMFGI